MTLRAITRPVGLSLTDWADNISLDLVQYGIIGSLRDLDWQRWGLQLINNPSIVGIVPDPYQFTDWRVWADRVCDALS